MMDEIVARKVIIDGEEVIELDLNKSRSRRRSSYPSYMDELKNETRRKPRKTTKDFIEVIS